MLMTRILVLKGGALGDFIVTLPTLQALRDRWPRAWIELIGNASAATLAQTKGLINRAESQHQAPWQRLYDRELPPSVRERLAAYDLVINYWPDPVGEIALHFPLRSDQVFLTAPAQPTDSLAAAHYLSVLHPLGLASTSLIYPLRLPRPQLRLIALHPGSGSSKKNWLVSRWAQLAEWLTREHQANLHIIRGEAESSDVLRGHGQSWDQLPLDALADHLATADLFIGHDSGISHLAASCGVRGILLFGPSNPAIWAPPTSGMTVLQAGATVDSISVETVQSAVSAALADQK